MNLTSEICGILKWFLMILVNLRLLIIILDRRVNERSCQLLLYPLFWFAFRLPLSSLSAHIWPQAVTEDVFKICSVEVDESGWTKEKIKTVEECLSKLDHKQINAHEASVGSFANLFFFAFLSGFIVTQCFYSLSLLMHLIIHMRLLIVDCSLVLFICTCNV